MDKVNELINILKGKVEIYFSNDASGHNIDHLIRTLKYALYLQSKEGGDIVVVAVAAFIHDIHRILSSEKKRYVSPKESLEVVNEFIKDLDITSKQKEHILYAIEHHEEYNFNLDCIIVDDIESKIVQDADNLDAIGAMGIFRTIKYSIAHDIKEYDPNVPLYHNAYNESKSDASTIHHIHNKLLRLGDYMNTETAKEIASKKTKLMKEFMDMYIEEFEGLI